MNNTDFTISTAYNEQDLANSQLFLGGLINFGYWHGLDITNAISHETRIQASKNLYNIIFSRLAANGNNRIIEIGCGRGYGIRMLSQLLPNTQIIGLDIFANQISKAYKIHKEFLTNNKNIALVVGKAENIPFCENYFDRILSVEAVQHFEDLNAFLHEVQRTLTPKGKLAITTFFATKDHTSPKLFNLFPYAAEGVDKFVPIEIIIEKLSNVGFDVTYESIGEHVWYGFDKWLEQTGHKDQWGTWGRNWLPAYLEGLVDYYIVTATKK